MHAYHDVKENIPLKQLFDSDKSVRLVMFPTSFGITPLSSLNPKRINSNLFSRPISFGIVPVQLISIGKCNDHNI